MADKITDNGILTDSPAVTISDYREMHGPPVFESGDVVIFADSEGRELSEWANALNVDRDDLSERMHDLARRHYGGDGVGDPWGVDDPVVFDARTFDMEDWIMDFVTCGLSASEALDFFMVEKHGLTQSFWARKRDVSQPTVAGNVSQARKKLGNGGLGNFYK